MGRKTNEQKAKEQTRAAARERQAKLTKQRKEEGLSRFVIWCNPLTKQLLKAIARLAEKNPEATRETLLAVLAAQREKA